jgi:hypothetical protein
MAIKQLLIRPSNIHGKYELSFQITEAHPVRRVIISRQELCALMTQGDRVLAREAITRV